MPAELGKLIDDLGLRMRLFRAVQESGTQTEDLTERDILLLELLCARGTMTVSEIAQSCPNVSESTISTNITKLWRNKKLVSKKINPENQRVTFVEITAQGREFLDVAKRMRAERTAALFKAMRITEQEREVMTRVTARAVEYFDEMLGFKTKMPELAVDSKQ